MPPTTRKQSQSGSGQPSKSQAEPARPDVTQVASPGAASTAESFVIKTVLVTVNGIFNVPPALLENVDASRQVLEIVLRPRVKYYYSDKRVVSLETRQEVMCFGEAGLRQWRTGGYVNFDAVAARDRDRGSSSSGGGGAPNNKFLFHIPTRSDLKAIVEVSFGVRVRQRGSTSTYRWLTPITSYDTINAPPEGNMILNSFRFQGLGDMNTNDVACTVSFHEAEVARRTVLTRFATLRVGQLVTTVSIPHAQENLMEARYYHEQGRLYYLDSIVAGGPNSPEALAHKQLVDEAAALNSSPACLQLYRDRLVADAVGRLHSSAVLYAEAFSRPKDRDAKEAYLQSWSPERLEQLLREGRSELAVGRRMILDVNPEYYPTRVQSLLAEYGATTEAVERVRQACAAGSSTGGSTGSSTAGSASPGLTISVPALSVGADAAAMTEQLLRENAGEEETVLRWLGVFVGPERNVVSPRVRYSFYVRGGGFSERELRAHTRSIFGELDRDVLDKEPEVFMRELQNAPGATPEALPTAYFFPRSEYLKDSRLLFRRTLRRAAAAVAKKAGPGGALATSGATASSAGKGSGGGGASVPPRLLQLSPNERPLVPIDPNSQRTSEIDILLEKYKGEFRALIPVVAAAMLEVVTHSGQLLQRRQQQQQQQPNRHQARTDLLFAPFDAKQRSGSASAEYDRFLTRLCDYTYISPSSLLAAIIYLDRLALRYPLLLVKESNVQLLVVVLVRIASKVVDLRSVNNKNFAHVFSISTADMNAMEERVLKIMDFDFILEPVEFNTYAQLLYPDDSGSDADDVRDDGDANAEETMARSTTAGTATNNSSLAGARVAKGNGHLLPQMVRPDELEHNLHMRGGAPMQDFTVA